MLQIHSKKQISARVVYAGPGVGGKTTNIRMIHKYFPDAHMAEIAGPGERTVGGDFLPVGVEPIGDWSLRIQLASVPGQIQYAETRASLLKGLDVVVFVADSLPLRRDANLYALDDLRQTLVAHGRKPEEVPTIFQYNKRDLPGARGYAEMESELNPGGAPSIGAVAIQGVGVLKTLDEAVTLARLEAQQYLGIGVGAVASGH